MPGKPSASHAWFRANPFGACSTKKDLAEFPAATARTCPARHRETEGLSTTACDRAPVFTLFCAQPCHCADLTGPNTRGMLSTSPCSPDIDNGEDIPSMEIPTIRRYCCLSRLCRTSDHEEGPVSKRRRRRRWTSVKEIEDRKRWMPVQSRERRLKTRQGAQGLMQWRSPEPGLAETPRAWRFAAAVTSGARADVGCAPGLQSNRPTLPVLEERLFQKSFSGTRTYQALCRVTKSLSCRAAGGNPNRLSRRLPAPTACYRNPALGNLMACPDYGEAVRKAQLIVEDLQTTLSVSQGSWGFHLCSRSS